jgi:hypothetical protein
LFDVRVRARLSIDLFGKKANEDLPVCVRKLAVYNEITFEVWWPSLK